MVSMTSSEPTEIQDDNERENARRLSLQGNEPPAEIEGYSIVRRLGTGAYGTVWLAREEHTGRMVAIKYYPHRRGLNWSLLNREVEKLATLYSSRNIVRLLDVGWSAEPPYYVMEFIENGSLGAYLASGPLSVEESVRIVQEVCDALIEAHGAGVLHCDLKPDNVLLDSQFRVRLCDFGQSRMSHEQSPALGTLYYMAPEQADLEAVPDARWDVYAVGALMYHMLTGQPPYRDADIQQRLEQADTLQERLELYQQHIRNAPRPELHREIRGIDRHLVSIIDQCLAVDPQDRLPNAQAIRSQLNSRDRNRARRPLLMLGVLGPILLISAMLPIFVGELNRILHQTEHDQIADEQNRNQLMARMHANALKSELDNRLRRLEDVVAEPTIVNSLTELMQQPAEVTVRQMKQYHDQPFESRPEWMQKLDAAWQAEMQWNVDHGRSRDTSWFLTDAQGHQIWRREFSEVSIGQNFAWRDYFHGKDVQYDPDHPPPGIEPIRQPHVSVAFISLNTKRYMVALSVPVRDEAGNIIGVFARTLHLGDLQRRLALDNRVDDSSHVIALADRRSPPVLLDHPWLTDDVFDGLSVAEARELFSRLELSDAAEAAIREALRGSDDQETVDIQAEFYEDPVGRLDAPSADAYAGNYIAAMSTIRSDRMPWLVIVQQNRAAALLRVRNMERSATRQAWLAVGASIVTMLLVWLFVWNALVRAKEPVSLQSQ